MTTPSPWRTVLTALGVVGMQLAAFVVGTRHGWTDMTARAYEAFCFLSWLCSLGQAGASTLQALANGTGLPGVKRVLMSDAKPGDPAPEVKP
jgi:hypothetical protein